MCAVEQAAVALTWRASFSSSDEGEAEEAEEVGREEAVGKEESENTKQIRRIEVFGAKGGVLLSTGITTYRQSVYNDETTAAIMMMMIITMMMKPHL